jgi:hypothetical protein
VIVLISKRGNVRGPPRTDQEQFHAAHLADFGGKLKPLEKVQAKLAFFY